MSKLIETIDNEFRVSHRIVAEQTGNQVKNVLDFITRHKNHFEEFGVLRFKNGTESLGTSNAFLEKQKSKTYYLNEQQATFLMTLLRNSPKVVEFKKALVKAFYDLKEQNKNIVDASSWEKIHFPHQQINIQDSDFRKVLYIAYGGKCFYTDEPLNKNDFHVDHILPISKGGKDSVANCVPTIPEYNLQKGNKVLKGIDNIQKYVLDFYSDTVIELFNDIKTAKMMKSKHNRVTMQGLKKSVMKELDSRFGEKVMNMFYSEVFGIPYDYNSYEDKANILLFLKSFPISFNTQVDKEKWVEEHKLYEKYSEFCLSKGNKILHLFDFRKHLENHIEYNYKKTDNQIENIYNIEI